MKNQTLTLRSLSLFLAGLILFASCSSTTIIQSSPSGAKLYLNGEPVGTTPYTYSDTKIVGSSVAVRLEKEGYDEINTYFSRDEEVDVGAVIGGIFFLWPFLWTMKYKPSRTYELTPSSGDVPTVLQVEQRQAQLQSKADRLRELKQLLDDGIITQEEFDSEKKKILEEGPE